MLLKQSVVRVKDNSKLTKVKIINLYNRKKLKFRRFFLAVVLETRNNQIKSGSINNFILTNLKKKHFFFSGRYKSTNKNFCVSIRDTKKIELSGTRFTGLIYSEIKNLDSQKIKVLIKKCI